MALRDLFIRVRTDTKPAEAGLGRLDDSALEAIKTFKKLYDQMDEGQKAAVRSFTKIDESVKQTSQNIKDSFNASSILGALGLGSVVSSFVKDSMEQFSKFERYSISLKSAFSDTEDPAKSAANAMKDINQFASMANFNVDQATESYMKLKDNGISPTTEQMMHMADIANAQGKDLSQLTDAITNISNPMKWKQLGIEAQKVGNQVALSFRGQRIVVDHTTQGVMEAMKTFGEMEGVVGMTAEISKTFEGRMSRLGHSMDSVKIRVGEFLNLVAGPVLDFFLDAEHGADRLNMALIFLGSFVLPLTAMAAWSTITPLLPMIGIAAAIAAAIAGIILVFEDLWVFSQGGDSLFGDFLQWLGLTPEEIQTIQGFLRTFFDWIVTAWDFLVGVFKKNPKLLGIFFLPLVASIGAVIAGIKGMIYLVRTIPIVWQGALQIVSQLIDTYIITPLKTLNEMVAEAFDFLAGLASQVFEGLQDFSIEVVNGLIDILNKVLGALSGLSSIPIVGDAMPDLSQAKIPRIEARATGGPVSSGQPYLVGEEGPEIIVPRGGGTVIPNGGGGSTFTLQMNGNIYLTGSADEAADEFISKVRDALNELTPEIEAKLGMMSEVA